MAIEVLDTSAEMLNIDQEFAVIVESMELALPPEVKEEVYQELIMKATGYQDQGYRFD